jgi:hypothetical protein
MDDVLKAADEFIKMWLPPQQTTDLPYQRWIIAMLRSAFMEGTRWQKEKESDMRKRVADLEKANAQLSDWKESAMVILSDWERVGKQLGGVSVFDLGRSKAEIALRRAELVMMAISDMKNETN